MALAEPLDAYFADFGAPITIGGVAVKGIFNNESNDVLQYAAGASPELIVKSADVSAVAIGTACVVNGVAYTVAKIDPDGTGMSRVILEKV